MIRNSKVKNKMKMKHLSLYIHIPFCVRKCDYCDFLSAPADDATKEAYVQALLLELESYADSVLAERKVKTVFIGGGTPSVLEEGQIVRILYKIKTVFKLEPGCEISMEINPGTVDKFKSVCYFDEGINRLSIGLQSADNLFLKRLGRIHTYEEFLATYDAVRQAGFRNVNIDLMSALPGQSVRQYLEGLRKVVALSPEHISAYSLIIEEGTPFFDKYNNNCDLLPDEQEDREMYEGTKEILAEAGYERYEISNYAKTGFECKHNIVYWERGDYLGIGLGSSSLIDNIRFKNECNLKKYIKAWISGAGESARQKDREVLTVQAQMEEFMFLGLRMMRGVSEEAFRRVFGQTMEEVYGRPISKMLNQDLLYRRSSERSAASEPGDYIALTDKGIDVSNYVFEHFLF